MLEMSQSRVRSSAAPRIALVSGYWGQNIGNAFFNIGGKWVLDQIFGFDNVSFVQDQPGYRTFHNQLRGNPRNDVGLLQLLDLDYIVLQGPLLTVGYRHLWESTFEALAKRGTKVILLGAAFFKFVDTEYSEVRGFLERYPPHLISTRDSVSYQRIRSWNLGVPIYDGLDSAFFVPNAYTPLKLSGEKYYAFNFDRYPEPTVRLGQSVRTPCFRFDADGAVWNLFTNRLVSRLAHRSKVSAYLGHLLDRRRLPIELNGRVIVRPEHRSNPHMTYKIYQHRNGIVSDEPWTYFTVYANAGMSLADRVHACIATLAYGRPAMLFTPSPRAVLFDRVGCGDIKSHPVSVDIDWLEDERGKELAWLRCHV